MKTYFKFRLVIAVAIFCFAFIIYLYSSCEDRFYRIAIPFFKIRDELFTGIIFILVAFLQIMAFALRAWGTAYLSSETVMGERVEEGKLVTEGPYKFVRNPLYLGDILGMGGIGITMPFLSFLVLTCGFVLHGYILALYEASVLEKRHGEKYRNYAKEVPLFFPRLAAIFSEHRGVSDRKSLTPPDWQDGFQANFYYLTIAAAFFYGAVTGSEKDILIFAFAGQSLWIGWYFARKNITYFIVRNKRAGN